MENGGHFVSMCLWIMAKRGTIHDIDGSVHERRYIFLALAHRYVLLKKGAVTKHIGDTGNIKYIPRIMSMIGTLLWFVVLMDRFILLIHVSVM